MEAAIDNDIIVKGACYGLISEMASAIVEQKGTIGVLGTAKYVISKRLERMNINGNKDAVRIELDDFWDASVTLEPDHEELNLAAELEYAAQQNSFTLDSGESILCAIVINRSFARLVTGDKRAVSALGKLQNFFPVLEQIKGKLLSLEQVVRDVMISHDLHKVRAAICAEPNVDRSLSICFSCKQSSTNAENVLGGLGSYIEDLRYDSNMMLCEP